MTLKRKEEKRKTLVFNLNFYSKEATKLTENSPQSEIKNRIESMRQTFRLFTEAVRQLEDEVEFDMEPIRMENMTVENSFVKALSKLQSLVIEADPIQNELGANASVIHTHETSYQHNFDVPTFSGNFEEWKSFKDLFLAAVVTSRLTDGQKLQKLKGLLRGDAYNAIKHLSITNENYRAALTLLNNRFENKRAIVNKNLALFFALPKIASPTVSAIRKLVDTTNECLYSLNAMNISTESWNPIIVHFIESRFDRKTFLDWEYFLRGTVEIPTLDQMTRFLDTQSRMLESVARNMADEKRLIESTSNIAATSTPKKAGKCHACSESHRLYECQIFKSKSPNERQKFISHKKLCQNCFNSSHNADDCKSKFRCLNCSEKHHTMLHTDNKIAAHANVEDQTVANDNEESEGDDDEDETPDLQLDSNLAHTHAHVLLATAMVHVRMQDKKKTLKIRALLDQGSQGSFVSESVTQQLRLKKHKANISVSGVSHTKTKQIKHIVEFEILSLDKKFTRKMSAMVIKSVTAVRAAPRVLQRNWKHVTDLELADPQFQSAGCIDLLIGSDMYGQLILPGLRKGTIHMPIAQNTELGWILSGPIDSSKPTNIISAHCNVDHTDDLLCKFWEMEEMPMENRKNNESHEAEIHFKQTYKRNQNGRYVVRLPFKQNERPQFTGTRNNAVRRLLQSEGAMKKKPELQAEYNKCLMEYIDLGHMKLSEKQGKNNSDGFFMAHHAVIKNTSTTTKVRPVFDASGKDEFGHSLNASLIVGPTLQPKLSAVLTLWRKFPFVISSDIVKMYRQIEVDERDTHYQQIVWRKEENGPIQNFTMNRLTFGTANAAFQAVRCVQQLAIDEEQNFPDIAESLMKSSYIDDFYMGAYSETDLENLIMRLKQFFAKGCFELSKWSTNCAKSSSVESHDAEMQTLSDESITRTLGINWHQQKDHFSFNVNFEIPTNKCTKRKFLSEISKIYDPLGFLAPFIVSLKIMMQSIYKLKINWDDALPNHILEKWRKINGECKHIADIKIDRWLHTMQNINNAMLIGFCDASENAYAAAVYLRWEGLHECKMNLVCAKTKVAPLTQKTIPKLELCAAVLLAELIAETGEILGIVKGNMIMFSDSQVAIAWITGDASKCTKFVQRRVSIIQQKTEAQHWRYVHTTDNPADSASRGISPLELKQQTSWFHGPQWCVRPINEWLTVPLDTNAQIPEIEIAVNAITTDEIGENEILCRFSSLHRLLRVTVYIFRFINAMRSKRIRSNAITVEEKWNAQAFWLKHVQQQNFKADMSALLAYKSVSAKSKISNLMPFIDGEGLLRVGGRLQNAAIPYNSKHPIILPRKSHLSNLIIDDAHERTLHGGNALTLAKIRTKFWILSPRSTIRYRIHDCVVCAIHRAKKSQQLMGNLPSPRVNETACFLHVGIDFCGPFEIKANDQRKAPKQKAYVCLFKCLATRAIDLELVKGMSTEQFLAAFKRFTARRGLCTDVYVDNGSNFIGAKNELSRMLQNSLSGQSRDIVNALLKDDIQFHFSPPRTPHFGGIWESDMSNIKYHMNRQIGVNIFTSEEMATLLAQIAAAINSRPLCVLRNDVDEISVLTPSHFLIGRVANVPPEPSLLEENPNRLNRWQRVQYVFHQFWAVWSKHVLLDMQQRSKWHRQSSDLRKGDVVLLNEKNPEPALKWLMGVVEETFPGEDGKVRVVDVRTTHSTYRRGITQLARLPIENDQ